MFFGHNTREQLIALTEGAVMATWDGRGGGDVLWVGPLLESGERMSPPEELEVGGDHYVYEGYQRYEGAPHVYARRGLLRDEALAVALTLPVTYVDLGANEEGFGSDVTRYETRGGTWGGTWGVFYRADGTIRMLTNIPEDGMWGW